MELSSLLPSLSPRRAHPLSLSPTAKTVRRPAAFHCRCSRSDASPEGTTTRRWFASLAAATAAVGIGFAGGDDAGAVSTSRRVFRSSKIPESDYTTLSNGIKYYDIKVGGGAKAVKGSRVAEKCSHNSVSDNKSITAAQNCTTESVPSSDVMVLTVHYVAKWKGITFMTSRQGLGVTGGSPYGFDVGNSERGNVLKGLDLGVEGMKVGGQRLIIVPPELAYGKKGVQEIPPNATIELDVELLSIKQSPFGSPVKIVEG